MASETPISDKTRSQFLDLPQEIISKIFVFAFSMAKTTYTPQFCRLDSETVILQQRGLNLIFRIPCSFPNLLVSRDYFASAIEVYGKYERIDVAVVQAGAADDKVHRKGSKLISPLEQLFRYTRTLSILEGRYTETNQNLDLLEPLFPRVDKIQICVEKILMWVYQPDNSLGFMENNRENHQHAILNLHQMNAKEADDCQNNKVVRSFDNLYEYLSVSKPSEDGLGLSCTTAKWPRRKELFARAWCYGNRKRAIMKFWLDLHTGHTRRTGLDYV